MVQSTDIVLDGVGYTLVPEKYIRAQDGAAEGRTGRVTLGDFFGGMRRHMQLERDRGWDGVRAGPAYGGQGVMPWGYRAAGGTLHSSVPVPTIDKRVPSVICRGITYLALGQYVVRLAAPGASWTSPAVHLDTGTAITDMCLYASNGFLCAFGGSKDVTWYRASDGTSTVLLAGEQGHSIAGYGGYAIWNDARSAGRPTYLRQVTGTQVDLRILDYDVRRLVNAGAKIYAVTDSAIYSYGGRVSEHTAPNPAYHHENNPDVPTTMQVLEWSGEWSPYFQHGVINAADDFRLFEGFGGRIYTWLAGEVVEDNPSGDRAGWRSTGLAGRQCFGGCVAGGYLVVSIESHEGQNELWAWDGAGWWKLDSRVMDANPWCWPINANNGGQYDVMVFRAGTRTLDLYRLRTRSASAHAYPADATFVTPMIDAGERDRDKVWRRVGAVFGGPERMGNLSSGDTVTVAVEYSLNGGQTWDPGVQMNLPGNTLTTANRTLEVAIGAPIARFIMLRARWSSVSDWAPVLLGLWAEFEMLDAPARRRKWTFDVLATDQAVDRDGQPLARSGRQLIGDLWNAWENGAPVSLRDIDYDAVPVERSVRIVGIAEKVRRPADQGRWGESTVSLSLVEM